MADALDAKVLQGWEELRARRLTRAKVAHEVRTAFEYIADLRHRIATEPMAPGAKRLLVEEIAFERRSLKRTIENAKAALNAPSPKDLGERLELDGTIDRLVDQFRDAKRRQEHLDHISDAIDQEPTGLH